MKKWTLLRSNLFLRLSSGLVGGPLLVGVLYYGGAYGFLIVSLLLIGATLQEFYALFRRSGTCEPMAWEGGLLSVLIFGLCWSWQRGMLEGAAFLWVMPALFTLFIRKLLKKSAHPFIDTAITLLGVVYLGGGFSMANFLVFRHKDYEPKLFIALMIMVWVYDSAAYFVGKWVGRHKMLPRVSPGKSWEGFLGGLSAVVALGAWYATYSMTLEAWVLIALVLAVAATLGDLSESLLKRAHGIKDSGKSIPGHGGFLDRFDALLFVLVFVTPLVLFLDG